MAIEPYSGLELDTTTEAPGGVPIKVISRSGLEHFLRSSRAIQEKLMSIPIMERIQVAGRLGDKLTERIEEGSLQELMVDLTVSTGYSERLIEGELAFIPAFLSSENLARCFNASLIGAPLSLDGFTPVNNNESIWHLPAGPSMIVSSGNSIIPTVVPTIISLVSGNATLLKPSLSNCAGVVEIFRTLDRLSPSVARDAVREALAISYYSHNSPMLRYALSEAKIGVINFWGGGQARASIRKMVTENPNNPRFFVNGPMTGAVLIDAESASDLNAESLALNIALYDQQLCSSPTIVLFVGGSDRAFEFAKKVASSLKEIGSTMPIKEDVVDDYALHGARRYLHIKGSKVLSSSDPSNPWTIVISDGKSALDDMVVIFPAMNFHGRKRFIEIVTVDSPETGMEFLVSLPTKKAFEDIDKVQTVGIALAQGKMEQTLHGLALKGVFRSVPLRGMAMRSSIEPYDGTALPALFTYTSYLRKKDIFPNGQVNDIFQA
jgi:hypothetical protein